MNLEMDKRSLYRGHVLSCHPELQEDGRFQARVAITCVAGDATPSQRFLDLDCCDTRQQALERARLAGVAWVDREWSNREIKPGVNLPIRSESVRSSAPPVHATETRPLESAVNPAF